MTNNVLVTGAGTGLGLEMATTLAKRGMTVYASVLDDAQRAHVETEAARHDVQLRILQMDITQSCCVEEAVNMIVKECGGIYGLVNNAGVSLRGYFEDLDDAEIRHTLNVNLFGSMAVTRAVLPHMRMARRGRIVFISSVGGRIAAMARTAYCASKFGLEGFAESLMQEVAPLGIQVSIIEPAIVKTERWTTNRGIARRATDPAGPYYAWFQQEEKLADSLVRTSPTVPAEVADGVYEALTSPRPRFRYVIGRRARLVLRLRRYLPGELFERLYFGEAMRRVTEPQLPQAQLEKKAAPVVKPDRTPTGVQLLNSLAKIVKVLGVRESLTRTKAKRISNETIRGFYATRSIIALENVGFFDAIKERGAVHLPTFAVTHNLDLRLLQSLCDYLYELKVLRCYEGYYSLDVDGRVIQDVMMGAFTLVYAYEDVFYNLEAMLKQEKTYGRDFTRRGEFVATGSGEVGKLLAFPMVAETIRRYKISHVLDLGCGDGEFLREMVTGNPHVTGYGIDLSPEGVSAGQKELERHNLQDRVHLLVGDMFNIDQVKDQLGPIDFATCIYVLHEMMTESRDTALELLRKFRSSFPGVRLAVCEVIRHSPDELRRKPGGVMDIQLFHALSNQLLFSQQEWRDVFREAGFTQIDEEYLAYARTAIFVVS